jgi:hypothetical protein
MLLRPLHRWVAEITTCSLISLSRREVVRPIDQGRCVGEPMVEKIEKIVRLQPDFNNRGAIRSVFDGRYRFSRYFSPIHFNRPTTYEALVANNDLEVYDLQEDPEETRNLAQLAPPRRADDGTE